MKISVVGLGYIGLPTAAIFAAKGIEVVGVDLNRNVVDIINSGKIHITEPDLDNMVHDVVKAGILKASVICENADIFIIAVPTPFKNSHEPDLSYVESAIIAISQVIKKGDLIIIESTSPVGTTEKISKILQAQRTDLRIPEYPVVDNYLDYDIYLAYCPERVLPGNIMSELVQNDRVIGGLTPKCALKARAVYQTFVEGQCILTDARTAEMCKLAENSFRDVNIAFANELSIICDRLNINVWNLISLANHHPRVNILKPGPGVGGHCIAVDPWFIVHSAPKQAKLIKAAREVNDSKPNHVIAQVIASIKKLQKQNNEISIAILGLAFKADVNDLRESPAVAITENLLALDFKGLYIVEPNINQLPIGLATNISSLVDVKKAINNSDIVLLLVDHAEFKKINITSLEHKQVVDTRGVWK